MIALFFIALFLVLLIVVYNSVPWAENKVLFLPNKKTVWTPSIKYNNVYIDIKNPANIYYHKPSEDKCDSYIHGWYFNNYNEGHKTVLFCHGNSLNISYRQYIVDICQQLELNLLIFDYRGFGKSSGKPSKHNLRQDGAAAYKYLTE